MTIVHDPRCADYHQPGHPERPFRVEATARLLRDHHPDWEWKEPVKASREPLLLAHETPFLEQLKNPAGDFDADTPEYPRIFEHAVRATGALLAAAEAAAEGPAFSLMRPPGHHATRNRAMGFCYLNHAAIAALSSGKKTAIWDFDVHHGNGTEAIVAGNEKICYASVHQYPFYPGTGGESFDNVRNFPVPAGLSEEKHLETLRGSLDALLTFTPELLIVSAGFDAYVNDPLAMMRLTPDAYHRLGTWIRDSEIPAAGLLEGGYSNDLPELIDAFLCGWSKERSAGVPAAEH